MTTPAFEPTPALSHAGSVRSPSQRALGLAEDPVFKPRIERQHFALARGWVQGIEADALAARYLPGTDLRVAKSTLHYVLEEIAASARRLGRASDAALLKRQASRIRLPTATPTLEEFAATLPDPDFFSEAELIAEYQAVYGAGGGGSDAAKRARQRRERLIDRQVRLINDVEAGFAIDVGPATPLAEWMRPAVAKPLAAAGIVLLAQLLDRIQWSAGRWYNGVRGIGRTKALRIEERLARTLGRPVPGSALSPARAQPPVGNGIVPIERLAVPESLSGATGYLRAPSGRCTIEARNDYEAAVAFFRTRNSPHTQRAYRKEIERFLLWCVIERRRAISDIRTEDCAAYLAFLVDPQPASLWCGRRNQRRFGALWRPFEGPLDARSRAHAATVLRGFYEWANRVGYLIGNPWAGVSASGEALPTEGERSTRADLASAASAGAGRAFEPLSRALTRQDWNAVVAFLDAQPECGRVRRLRFVLALAYTTGLRRSELVRAQVQHLSFHPPSADSEGGWMLRVVGKRNRVRSVPIMAEVIEAMSAYFAERGLPADFSQAKPGTFLIGRQDDLAERLPGALDMEAARLRRRGSEAAAAPYDPADGIKEHTLYGQVKALFGAVAQAQDAAGRTASAKRLRAASTHWLRHTFGSHAVAAGMPLEVLGALYGHASLSTTSHYVDTESGRRLREIRRLASSALPARRKPVS